jgi:hypothetical protein
MPERIFRQEFLAEFIEDSGCVFRRVQEAATAQPQEKSEAQHEYVFGVDWGRVVDFTAVAVVDATGATFVATNEKRGTAENQARLASTQKNRSGCRVAASICALP